MPRRPCSVTQSVIERAIKAARHTGARAIKIEPDGRILIDPAPGHGENLQITKERLEQTKDEKHFVYAIYRYVDGLIKIGISNDVNRRHSDLRLSYGKLDICYIVAVKNEYIARQLEACTHIDLRYCREDGEWFNIAIDDAIAAIQRSSKKIGVTLQETFLQKSKEIAR